MTTGRRGRAGCWTMAWVTLVFAVAFLPQAGSSVSARQVPATAAPPAAAVPSLSLEQKEAFLKTARVIRTRGAGKGVTGTSRATLSDGTLTHDASIQTIDEHMQEFKSNRGVEFNFRDSWRYNVAAYRLDRLLDIGMTPPSVERIYQNREGSFTWWVDEVMMDEGARLKSKASSPDATRWNHQMWVVRLFDQLIYNVDRNLGNLLIDKEWNVWMIDHSRAFRLYDKLKSPGSVTRCDRRLLERLKALDMETLKATMDDYLTGPEMRGVLARRTELVALIEKAGPTALYDRAR